MRALGIALLVLIALIALVAAAQTAPSGASPPGGVDFKCSALTRKCSCKGNWEGADCKAMKKNCDLSKGWACSNNPRHRCSCTLSASYRDPKSVVERRLKVSDPHDARDIAKGQ